MASLPNLPRYDELRARGEGELLDRFLALASSTMDKLDEVLRLADGPNSAFTQKMLDNCATRARLMKKHLSEDIAWPMLTPSYGSLGEWGENGRGPQVDDLLKSARWTAERSDEHLSGRDEPLSLAPVQVTYGMGGRIAA